MSELKSRHAFGSEANIEAALAAGAIDAHDILFLNEGKIGWIDKDGQPIILEGKKQIVPVSSLPETGENGVVYIYDNQLYLWDGTQFVSLVPTDKEILTELIEADLLPTVTTNDKILTDKNNRIVLRY